MASFVLIRAIDSGSGLSLEGPGGLCLGSSSPSSGGSEAWLARRARARGLRGGVMRLRMGEDGGVGSRVDMEDGWKEEGMRREGGGA